MIERLGLKNLLTVLYIITALSILNATITDLVFLEYFSTSLHVSMFVAFYIKLLDAIKDFNLIILIVNFCYLVTSWFINGDIVLNLISGVLGLILYSFGIIVSSISQSENNDNSQYYSKYKVL